MSDVIEQRYLGAMRCVDRTTGAMVTRVLHLSSDTARLFRNISSLYVIREAPGLQQYTASFDVIPDSPALASVTVDIKVIDPLGKWLPRIVRVDLPRDADTQNQANAESLFRPVNVNLYAAPNADTMVNWSTVRVSVMRTDTSSERLPVKGALLRIVRVSDDEVLSSGLSDERGEALVIIPGVPLTQFAEDDDSAAVTTTELEARLEVSIASGQPWPVNPDDLENNHADNLVATETLALKTGRMEKLVINLTE